MNNATPEYVRPAFTTPLKPVSLEQLVRRLEILLEAPIEFVPIDMSGPALCLKEARGGYILYYPYDLAPATRNQVLAAALMQILLDTQVHLARNPDAAIRASQLASALLEQVAI